jgi:hypothetical protein
MPQSLEDLTVDQLLATAQQALPSHQLLSALANNPATRAETLRLVKRINPNLAIPELDAKADVESQIEALKQQILERDNQARERDAMLEVERQRDAVRKQYGFSDEDIGEMEKLMIEEGIARHATAAKLYAASKQAAIPTASEASAPVFDLPNKDIWGAGVGNNAKLNKIATEEAFRALNDIKAGRIAGV